MDGILQMDRAVREAASKADAAFQNALQEGGPDKFIWHSKWNGNQWDGNLSPSARDQLHRVGLVLAEKEAARERVVYRDPCPKCGTRGDIGCKHWRA